MKIYNRLKRATTCHTTIFILTVFLLLSCLPAATIAAPTPAIDFSGVSANYSYASLCLGFEFTVDSDTLVTHLGLYDADQDGLTGTHAVGIYDAAENLLISDTVTPAHALDGFFRYVSVESESFHLLAGETYYIVAVTGGEHLTYDPTGFSVASGINFLNGQTGMFSDTLVFPYLNSSNYVGYFGPNFKFEGAPVPVPGTIWLIGSALGGLLFVRRRSSK
jgi:hypothetical protein